ncbi:hypothetical protein [Spiroplasma endosymbiont of Notiophilus biguttatus]|uniref:hypothetical protein n=1 Tax=Spiroplasma endosymbiont of Notiophilus biguttatus TaxID=3066285 RepID=UPI00313EF1D8
MNEIQQTISFDYNWNQKTFTFKFISVETVSANNNDNTKFVRGYFNTELNLNLYEF